MLKAEVRERLRWAQDQCPLPGSPIPSLHHTRWYAEAHSHANNRYWQPSGWTAVVAQNRLLSWYRSFTATPPNARAPGSRPSLITVYEWLPRYEPKPVLGWVTLGRYYTAAYARLHTDYVSDWRSHARRHLKNFQNSQSTLRLGSKDDVVKLYATSQVPPAMQAALLKSLDQHLAAHPESIEILVAEHDGRATACLVAGYCDEAGLSEYIIGAFHPEHKKDNPMVGLVDWWYRRSLERGHTWVTFGHMEPAVGYLPMAGNGYSFFKTHFGVARMWFPKNRWRVTFNHKALFSKPQA